MAPTRKSRSVNKRFSYPNEISPAKDGDTANKSNKRKRKVSDMLGAQWSKEELQRFYEAYRKYGKDWKKVAAAVRNRSVEMVEALYTMNRAYLSLPEGTASVVGLIAMMTDHYSVLEGSDSEQESNDGVGMPRKSHKRTRAKGHPNTARNLSDVSHSQAVASNYGCLSLLKKKRSGGNQPRAVGKRTPRIPVRYTYDKDSIGRYISPVRQGPKSKLDANDDDVAHEVALTLAEASHRGGSPQVSQTPSKRRETVSKSPGGLGEGVCSESEMTSAKNVGNEMDDFGCEGSLGSTEGDNNFSREKPQSGGRKGAGRPAQQKAKKSYGKKVEAEDTGHHGDDIKEACSGTEGGQRFSCFELKHGPEARDATFIRPSGQASKKRSKKVLFGGDEGVALDALQALADLSFMMPSSTAEAESTAPHKEDKESDINTFRPQDTIPTSQRVKPKFSPSKKKGDQTMLNSLVSESKKSKLAKVSALDSSPVAEIKDLGMRKRKPKSSAFKNAASEVQIFAGVNAFQEKVPDQGLKSVNKIRQFSNNASQQQLGHLVKISEHSSSSTDIRRDGDDSAVSSVQAPETSEVNVPTKSRSKRKVDKAQIQRSDIFVNEQSNTSGQSYHDKTVYLKERLCNCLSSHLVRRWCVYEWFYSAIDYPWFAKCEFVEYLYHVGLGHVPRLTRVEWGVIRSSLGKPRRFSQQFLKEEKEKLNYYRESVRSHYSELRMGKREGLPTDLARPLTVGQRVIAIHPRSREIHNGKVLTVDHNVCRIQFDRPELGVEFVKDIDCMPLNPVENMPTSLKRHDGAIDKFYEALKQFKANERSEDRMKEEIIKLTPSQKMESALGTSNVAPFYQISDLSKQAKDVFGTPSSHEKTGQTDVVSPQQSALFHLQAKEADIRALAELSRALDKKNALVTELKRMNDDVYENHSLKYLESFKKQYAAVLVQLNEVLDQVSSALTCLRQRNTYQGNSLVPWQKTKANLDDHGSVVSSLNCFPCDSQRTGSHVCEIVDTSRIKARKMVDAALKAISSLNVAMDTIQKIEEVVDFVNNQLMVDDSGMSVQASQLSGSLSRQNQLINVVASEQAHDSRSNGAVAPHDAKIPSELIANCVATLLMIQKCTERQFPPAEVAQILNLAVTSLQPCCSQNVPIYAEIQKCMGIIRSQILALVPT
ncbi:protein ALWAYS EARLY 3-like isoform X2 [Chenopodium quinoa]|uniref:protein ALWAYS EARLY 3-like isoform X2 n=1 Tax=Chenopodium quinoa TaxID=63459 RepID=UPI000B799313|nr:protein ALWAYS EARLY 3-like isoform X2 [Chenopodium quinoa]